MKILCIIKKIHNLCNKKSMKTELHGTFYYYFHPFSNQEVLNKCITAFAAEYYIFHVKYNEE